MRQVVNGILGLGALVAFSFGTAFAFPSALNIPSSLPVERQKPVIMQYTQVRDEAALRLALCEARSR